jgi:hypothetical protein
MGVNRGARGEFPQPSTPVTLGHNMVHVALAQGCQQPRCPHAAFRRAAFSYGLSEHEIHRDDGQDVGDDPQ